MSKQRIYTVAEIAEAYKDVASSASGALVLADLERRFGFSTVAMFDGDPYRLTHRDGQRSVVAHIGRMLEFDDQEPEVING